MTTALVSLVKLLAFHFFSLPLSVAGTTVFVATQLCASKDHTPRKGSKILITKYGIKALFDHNETDAVKIDKYMLLKSESEFGENYLLAGKVDDVEYRYYVGNSDSPVTKEDIAKISNTAYVQGLFPQMKK